MEARRIAANIAKVPELCAGIKVKSDVMTDGQCIGSALFR
jgi:hypothetical protein